MITQLLFEYTAKRTRHAAHLVLTGLIALLPVVLAAAQPGDGFPRHIPDATGQIVTIPARPVVVAVLGRNPAAEVVIAAADRRMIDPVRDDPALGWDGTGLLLIPAPYAAVYPAWRAAAGSAGVPVLQTAPVTSLDGWQAAIRQIGRAAGRDDRAAAVLCRLRWQRAAARAIVHLTGENGPLPVLVLTPEGYTFGRGTLIDDLIVAAGGINVAAGYDDFRQIDDSTIRTLAPRVILLSPAWSDEARAAFVANPAYASVPAVQTGRVHRLPFSPTQPPDPGAALIVLALLLAR